MRTAALAPGIEELPAQMFMDCGALEDVVLPPTITTIGASAFEGTGLLSIELPGSATDIGARAFAGSLLSRVTLSSHPDVVADGAIGDGAFSECSSLEEIEIPKGVLAVGESAFADCSSLTSVSLPDGLTTIGDNAFRECSSLQSISIPEGVTALGIGVFYCWSASACRSELVTVDLPDSLLTIGASCFYDCRKLAGMVLPPNLVSLGSHAFYGCAALPEVTIPDGLETIGRGAFVGCESLTAVSIPRGVASIGATPFTRCSSLISISVEPGNGRYHAIDGVLYDTLREEIMQFPPGRTGRYAVPNGVKRIAVSAFETSRLEGIEIPATVAAIGNDAFDYCWFLREIEVAEGNSAYRSIDGVLFDATGTILIRFPSGRAGRYAIPQGTERVRERALAAVPGLTGVVVPSSVLWLESSIFYDTPLQSLAFAGDAPSLRSNPFTRLDPGAAVLHLSSATGYDASGWQNLRTVAVEESAHPASRWMLNHGISPHVPLSVDLSGDGVSILAAYALGLDPRAELSGSLPAVQVDHDSVSLTYRAVSPGVSYLVEASTDLKNWNGMGIALSGDGDQQTATMPRDGSEGFLRLLVDYSGPGTAQLRPGEELKISFDSAAEGAVMGFGGGGATDSLGWADHGTSAVRREEISDGMPPVWTGPALVIHDGTADFVTEAIEISSLPSRIIEVSIDFRAFENSSFSNFEDEDRVEAWIEASRNGLDFVRIAGADVIPLTTGDRDLIYNNPPDPNIDELKKLELPAGASTTFGLRLTDGIHPDFRFVRIHLVAENHSGSEWFLVDNVCVRAPGGL